jgi:4'-phosphopantetheinyl transferase EntD
MPLLLRRNNKSGGIMAVWHITESVDELCSKLNLRNSDIHKLNSYKIEHRKLEFLATRCLVKEILDINPEIDYRQSGKPVLSNSVYNISISHTKNFAAIALSKNNNVGIDIEYPSDRVCRVYKRFISPEEHTFIPNGKETEYYTIIWCLKETMYKLFDEKSIIFNRHLKCMPFIHKKEGVIDALYKFNDEVLLKYKYLVNKEFYLVYHC